MIPVSGAQWPVSIVSKGLLLQGKANGSWGTIAEGVLWHVHACAYACKHTQTLSQGGKESPVPVYNLRIKLLCMRFHGGYPEARICQN